MPFIFRHGQIAKCPNAETQRRRDAEVQRCNCRFCGLKYAIGRYTMKTPQTVDCGTNGEMHADDVQIHERAVNLNEGWCADGGVSKLG